MRHDSRAGWDGTGAAASRSPAGAPRLIAAARGSRPGWRLPTTCSGSARHPSPPQTPSQGRGALAWFPHWRSLPQGAGLILVTGQPLWEAVFLKPAPNTATRFLGGLTASKGVATTREILGRFSHPCPLLLYLRPSRGVSCIWGVSLSQGLGLGAFTLSFLRACKMRAHSEATLTWSFFSFNISLWTNFGNKIYHKKFNM